MASKECAGTVFFAADEVYFQRFGLELIRSAMKNNPDWHIFVYLYNPSPDSISALAKLEAVTFDTELLDEAYFVTAARYLKRRAITGKADDVAKTKRVLKTIKAHDRNRWFGVLAKLIQFAPWLVCLASEAVLISYLKKVYFACQRFVVLNKICAEHWVHGDVLALDADSFFNAPIFPELLREGADVCLKHRSAKNGQSFLAGAMLFPINGRREALLGELSVKILERFSNYDLEWGLDQILLNDIVPGYCWEPLDNRLGDLAFSSDSSVWLAKGNSKDLLTSPRMP